jgi:hypothetical protein
MNMEDGVMNKEAIARELRSMVEERLFGEGPWSSDDLGVNQAMSDNLSALGLQHVDPVTGNIWATDLGQELDVDTMTVFMGHHEPFEVPDKLVPLITGAEADELTDRFNNGERPEEVLPPLLRRLWREQYPVQLKEFTDKKFKP